MDDDTMMPDAPTVEQQRQPADEMIHSDRERRDE
jgi:hypothetical protein